MGYSQADKIQSRERILQAASAQIGRQGLDSLAIADIMREAGLTVGAFYGHFASRDELVAEAARRMMSNGQAHIDELLVHSRHPTLKAFLDIYFDVEHIRDAAAGCGICSLVGEARYASDKVRAVVAQQYTHNVAQVAALLGGGKAALKHAKGVMISIVGAVNLARAVEDPAMAKDILHAAREQILRGSREFET